jgi:hypothetical protein
MEIPNSFDMKKQNSEFLSSEFGKCRFRDSGLGAYNEVYFEHCRRLLQLGGDGIAKFSRFGRFNNDFLRLFPTVF